LFFREPHNPDTWVAQALEHDIAAYGKDIQHAKLAFERTLSGYIAVAGRKHQQPLTSLAPAPDSFWEIWQAVTAQQSMTAEPIPSIPGHIVPAVANEPIPAAH